MGISLCKISQKKERDVFSHFAHTPHAPHTHTHTHAANTGNSKHRMPHSLHDRAIDLLTNVLRVLSVEGNSSTFRKYIREGRAYFLSFLLTTASAGAYKNSREISHHCPLSQIIGKLTS